MANLKHPLERAVASAMLIPRDFHRKVLMVARHLVKDCDDDDAIVECIWHAAKKVRRRRMSRGEVINAVNWARKGKGHGTRVEKPPRQTPFNPALAEQVDSIDWNLEKMTEQSAPIPDDPGEALSILYDGDPYLCIGYEVHDFAVRKLSEWRQLDISRHERLCPNPFNAPFLTKEDGSTSFKCNELIKFRKFLVVEFDEAELDQQVTRLAWLGKRFALALVLFSGGKSLHGYYRADDSSLPRLRVFFELALQLGADRAMWTPSQFSRLPGGVNHKTGAGQRIIFIHGANAGRRRYQ